MSFDALAWAAKQHTGSAGTKLVLLGLAECASRGDATAFPSTDALVEFSSLDRKSVIANLDRLQADGFISDTGQRAGRTRQIKVYKLHLNLVPTVQGEHHYVYRLTDQATGAFYIGVRSWVGTPSSDRYMGSGKWPTGAAFHGVDLQKLIVAEFATRTEAEAAEAEEIGQALLNPLCKNIAKEAHKRDALESLPKTGLSKAPVFPSKASQKRDTDTVREPVSSGAKAPSPRGKFPPPPNVELEQWLAFGSQRKKPLNARSYKLICNKLVTLAEDGWPPGDMIDLATERGWETVFKPRTFGNERTDTNPTGTALRRVQDALRSRSAFG